jgi:ABC-2 type transport system ATP-binding protein
MTVPAAGVYGLLGPNGAGKTTTLRLVCGLLHPDAGSIELFGTPSRRQSLRRVGSLIEEAAYYPYLSARQNLRAVAATGEAPASGRIDEVLSLVDLTGRADDRVATYSLGMRQRLGIAAALLNDPPLLVLDEPANGLDPAGIMAIRALLLETAARGKAVLVSSHNLREMEAVADRVGIIANGRMVREGSLGEVLASSAVRVQVPAGDTERAIRALVPITAGPVVRDASDRGGWLSVPISVTRSSEVVEILTRAGIALIGLSTSADLEDVFVDTTVRASR